MDRVATTSYRRRERRARRRAIKYTVATAVAIGIYMALEYQLRGYFAIGAEILFPFVALAMFEVRKKRG